MIHFVVPQDSEFGIQDYLGLHGAALAPRMTVCHYEDLPRRAALPGGVYILSALDQLYPGGLRLAGAIADQLHAAGVALLNHPARAMRRFELLEELAHRGLNVHRALRATADLSALRYPVFLRNEHHHTGALTALLDTPARLQAELGRAVLRGLTLEDLLVVEFCDTAAADGSYRKYAAFIVGREVIPRSMARGAEWALKHSGSEFTRDTADEERTYVLGNPHEAELRRIFAIAGIEYGRVDYALRDGAIETWEINLNPTIGRGSRSHTRLPPEIRAYRAIARDHFYARFQAALEEVDRPGGVAEIPMSYPRTFLQQLGPLSRPVLEARRFEPMRRVLRPFRPVLDPLLRILSPLLGKAVRRDPPVR